METYDENTSAHTDDPVSSLSAYQLWQVHKRRLALRKAYLDGWEATSATTSTGRPIDAIIAPIAAGASAPHGKNKYRAIFYHRINIITYYTQISGLYTCMERARLCGLHVPGHVCRSHYRCQKACTRLLKRVRPRVV
jgi:hypothetical protein